jgi:hypothetical protein
MTRKFKKYLYISTHSDRVEALVNDKINDLITTYPDEELEFEFSDITFRTDSVMINQFIVVYQIIDKE